MVGNPPSESVDPVAAARAAGLRYVTDDLPGITRARYKDGFRYFDPNGKRVRDKKQLQRIRAIAVPPAYEDVWICPLPNGHIQATARDTRHRKQYRYHAKYREIRDENKYDRMLSFGKSLPAIRRRLKADLKLKGLPREKVLAAVVELLAATGIRVGNEEYAKANSSFGLTTLRSRHAKIDGSTLRFSFRGKSGVRHAVDLRDRALAKVVSRCQDLPGQNLFQYVTDDGETRDVDSSDVNDYIREISGADFSAKDFRTWAGTVACARLLAQSAELETLADRKSNVVAVIKEVARILRNTPAVCRKCYVHPHLLDAYMESGRLERRRRSGPARWLSESELLVLSLLRAERKDSPAPAATSVGR